MFLPKDPFLCKKKCHIYAETAGKVSLALASYSVASALSAGKQQAQRRHRRLSRHTQSTRNFVTVKCKDSVAPHQQVITDTSLLTLVVFKPVLL